ncbi:LOW QUALITY PROTEIN: Subtilisin-like protease, fibronectin type-III domain [Dillenia turbinata]|uniref:Subtilisin-like protease, fibronectin type-III domain n=1 Tax=Dillenia turbinata TaxID=194707 RepID=A0AAN8VKR0_9MAGN
MEGVVAVFPSETRQLLTTRSWDFLGLSQQVIRIRKAALLLECLILGFGAESASFSDTGFGAPPSRWKGICGTPFGNFSCNKYGISINTFLMKNNSYPIVYGGDVPDVGGGFGSSNSRVCEDNSLDKTKINGTIVLCGALIDGSWLLSVGVAGLVMRTQAVQDVAYLFPLPASILDSQNGSNILSYIHSARHPTATILKSNASFDPLAPYVVSFSSRGPNPITSDILKTGQNIQVQPSVLTFKTLGQKLSFKITLQGVINSSSLISASLVWSDGVYQMHAADKISLVAMREQAYIVYLGDNPKGDYSATSVHMSMLQDEQDIIEQMGNLAIMIFNLLEIRKAMERTLHQQQLGVSLNTFELKDEYPLVYAGDVPNVHQGFNSSESRLCSNNSLDQNLVKGKIVLCDGLVIGVEALRVGAAGMITRDGGFKDWAFASPLPASHLSLFHGREVIDYIRSTSNPTATILKSFSEDDAVAPYVISFSSRGPNPITPDLLKKLSFVVKIRGTIATTPVSAVLIWYNGVDVVRSPIIVYDSA